MFQSITCRTFAPREPQTAAADEMRLQLRGSSVCLPCGSLCLAEARSAGQLAGSVCLPATLALSSMFAV